MNKDGIRLQVLEHIRLLASPSEQRKYEQDVPIACVPDELICGFTDDLFHPKSPEFIDAFSEDELKSLCELYGVLCLAAKSFSCEERSLANFQKNNEFRIVVSLAKELQARFG